MFYLDIAKVYLVLHKQQSAAGPACMHMGVEEARAASA
jgi:hypothetical protein